MARKFVAGRALALVVLAVCCAAPPAAALEIAKIDGVSCVDAAAYGGHFGLGAKWLEPDKRLLLEDAGTRMTLEVNQRELVFDGRHVWMGSPAVYHGHSLWISFIDAEKVIRPLLRLGLDRPPPVRTIIIDPGHGIPDNGTENKHLGLKERVLTLDTAFRLEKILEARGYRVVMTRTTDRALSPEKKLDLRMRDELIAQERADLFISIHYNAAGQYAPGESLAAVHGTETYRFTPRYQVPLSRSTHHPEDDEANPGDSNAVWNTVLAYCIQRAVLGELGTYDRGLRHDKLGVLRLASCPAVLIEAGYLSNDAEARKIATPAYREQIAEGIAAGIRAYVDLGRPPPASAPAQASAAVAPAAAQPAPPSPSTAPAR